MMKTFLLAFMAFFAMQFAARATIAAPEQSELVPADQLAAEDGLVDYPRPPYPPYPHPHPVPPPHYPHPHPVPPPHPHPHPVPPPPHYWWYECSSEDPYGRIYFARGRDPIYTQRSVHDHCEVNSGAYCHDLGCRRI